MKKNVLLAAIAATVLFTACNSCNNNKQEGLVIEGEIDSLYMINDSTIGDKQTFIFEGLMPMDNGGVGNVLLSIQTINLNEDGTYTINTTYMDENANPATINDSGNAFVLIGIPNDSTAVVYELISENSYPKMNLQINSDSSLTRLNNKMQPMSQNPAHRLKHKK